MPVLLVFRVVIVIFGLLIGGLPVAQTNAFVAVVPPGSTWSRR